MSELTQEAQTTTSAEEKVEQPATQETVEAKAEAPQESMVTAPKVEEKEAPSKEDPGKPAVPEKYELKLPENSKLDAAFLTKVESLAKEKGWSQERAQDAVNDRHNALVEFEQEQLSSLATLNDKTWKDELMRDPEFGGQKFEEHGHMAYRAAEKFGGKEFAEELKSMKLNHHPKLFKFLARVGKAMESDTIVITNNKSSGKLPPEQRMYPEMFNKES